MTDDPPSPAERAFLDLLRRPVAYSRWAAQVRAEWVARKKAVARKDELGQGGEVANTKGASDDRKVAG